MYAAEKEDTLARKLRSFYEKLDYLKTCAQSLAMPEFLSLVATEFDFETYLACVPDGEMKRTAFSQFLGMAAQLCAAQGNSLYLLLRALHETKKRDGAYVKAAMAAGGADCVHITTIHSSKGLEYPIVYVANLERRLTVQDFKNRMLIHSDSGLMMQYIDEPSLVRRSTIELCLLYTSCCVRQRGALFAYDKKTFCRGGHSMLYRRKKDACTVRIQYVFIDCA